MSALSDIELYEFLGLEKFASEKEIKKAYRKLALKLHPDKNPENNTVEKFKKLAIVYEILTNIEKKEEYDQKLRAKEQVKKRNRERNAHAQELKRQFDEREKAYQERKKEEERKKKEKEDERRRLLEEERRRLHEEALELERKSKRFCTNEDESEGFKVRVSWKASKKDKEPAYTTEEVTEIFSQYGQILFVVKSPVKEGRYMIVFADKESAILSSTVGGKPSHPLTVKLSFDVGKMPLASKMMQERPDPQVSSFEDLLKRYGIDQKVPSDFGKAPEKSEPKLEEFDERTGLPVKYVYAHGTDTIFACAATFSLPPEIRLRGDEEVEYGGYIVRLWPNERDKYVGLDD